MIAKSFSLLLLLVVLETGAGQAINGCPSYGCNPSGTFSYKLTVPRNASVAWTSDFFIGPLPAGLGCVGNSNNLVCQYNSPREVGYISIDVITGKLLWKDSVLRFPTLPIMDVFGDIIGSDGNNLVRYETNGKLDNPIIHLGEFIHPIYSLMVSDDNMVLIVSKNGVIISYQTNGIPDAAIWLNGTVERTNGTFIPAAQPILAGNRLYIVTEFVPDDVSVADPSILGMQRLYAIDVFDRMVDRLHITWYMNFERETLPRDFLQPPKSRNHISHLGKKRSWKKIKPVHDTLQFKPRKELKQENNANEQPIVLFHSEQSMVFVYLPPPEDSNALPVLWGLKDAGDNSALLFKIPSTISSLATYRMNDDNIDTSLNFKKKYTPKYYYSRNLDKINPRLQYRYHKNRDSQDKQSSTEIALWVVSGDGDSVMKLSPTNGSLIQNINVSSLLKTPAKIVSNIMVARETDNGSDILITGVTTSTDKSSEFLKHCHQSGVKADNTGYVIAFNENDLLWMVATPNNTQVKGQIAGIPKPNPVRSGKIGDETRDELVVFAGTNEFSVVFSIH